MDVYCVRARGGDDDDDNDDDDEMRDASMLASSRLKLFIRTIIVLYSTRAVQASCDIVLRTNFHRLHMLAASQICPWLAAPSP